METVLGAVPEHNKHPPHTMSATELAAIAFTLLPAEFWQCCVKDGGAEQNYQSNYEVCRWESNQIQKSPIF
jgi:hypothetical protein